MLDFVCPLDAETIERQIFDLMFTGNGYGLGMAYNEIMRLDVSRKDRLLEQLYDALERARDAAAGN